MGFEIDLDMSPHIRGTDVDIKVDPIMCESPYISFEL
jgi:hypothetical protein